MLAHTHTHTCSNLPSDSCVSNGWQTKSFTVRDNRSRFLKTPHTSATWASAMVYTPTFTHTHIHPFYLSIQPATSSPVYLFTLHSKPPVYLFTLHSQPPLHLSTCSLSTASHLFICLPVHSPQPATSSPVYLFTLSPQPTSLHSLLPQCHLSTPLNFLSWHRLINVGSDKCLMLMQW